MKTVHKFLFMLVLAVLVPVAAFAQPAQWTEWDSICRGEPMLRTSSALNPACTKRDALSKQLAARGWLQASHGVWISPEQQGWFVQALNRANGQLTAHPEAIDLFPEVVPALLTDLRAKMTDAQIFAAWNTQRQLLTGFFPWGSAALNYGLQKLEMHYSRTNDPRYVLER